MKLLDLDPRWYCATEDGPRVGFTFECPHCQTTRLAVAIHAHGMIDVDHADVTAATVWDMTSPPDFALMTLTPSIDASSVGHWHGFISNGQIV